MKGEGEGGDTDGGKVAGEGGADAGVKGEGEGGDTDGAGMTRRGEEGEEADTVMEVTEERGEGEGGDTDGDGNHSREKGGK